MNEPEPLLAFVSGKYLLFLCQNAIIPMPPTPAQQQPHHTMTHHHPPHVFNVYRKLKKRMTIKSSKGFSSIKQSREGISGNLDDERGNECQTFSLLVYNLRGDLCEMFIWFAKKERYAMLLLYNSTNKSPLFFSSRSMSLRRVNTASDSIPHTANRNKTQKITILF